MSGDDLEEFRREFAAMNEKIQNLDPNDPVALSEVHTFLERQRSAPAPRLTRAMADAFYLEGLTSEVLAERLGRSHTSITLMLGGTHGPREYVAVRRGRGGRYEVRRVPVETARARAIRREVAELREQGWRFAPAVWQVDPERVDPAELWDRLDKMEADS